MVLKPLGEWAKEHGISPVTARKKAQRGTLSAFKIGRNYVIDENVPNVDKRIKSGKYIKKSIDKSKP